MALDLAGAQGLFIHMQEALFHVKEKRITMICNVHDTLDHFHWLAKDIEAKQHGYIN